MLTGGFLRLPSTLKKEEGMNMKKVTVGHYWLRNDRNWRNIPAYMKNEDVEIKYFCDIIPERAKEAVEEYGCGIAVEDYHDVLTDPEVEAVSVCSQTRCMRRSQSTQCARQACLCEKPAARTYAEALEMQKVQHETMTLNIGVVNRFNDMVNLIRNYIQEVVWGNLYVYISFGHSFHSGIGRRIYDKGNRRRRSLIDWGVHYLDLVMYCLNDPKPLTVSGETFCKLAGHGRLCIPGYVGRPPQYDGVYDGRFCDGADPYGRIGSLP